MSGEPTNAARAPGPGDAAPDREPPPGADLVPAGARDHLVQFHSSDEVLITEVAGFLRPGLDAGDAAVVIATARHRAALARALDGSGADIARSLPSGRVQMLDAGELLEHLMEGERPDRARFRARVGAAIRTAAGVSRTGRVRAFGEMVDLLWRAGNPAAALELESLWNELLAEHPLSLYCAYLLAGDYDERGLRDICAAHTHVVRAPAPDGKDRDRRAARAPLTADQAALLTAEIGRRKEVERALRDSLHDVARAERLARASREELAEFLDGAAIAVHAVGPDARILWANRAELAMLGYEPDEYIGRPISDFHADPRVAAEILDRLGRGETLKDVPAQLRAKDGRIVDVVITSNCRFDNGEMVHTRCFTRDVTDQRRLEASRAVATRRSEQLLAITAAIAEAVSPDDVYTAIVDQVSVALGASTGALWALSEDGARLELLRQVGYPPSIAGFDRVPVDVTARFPALDTLAGEPIWIGSQAELLARYPNLAAVVTPGRSYQIACLPVLIGGTPHGSLAFTFENVAPLDEDERSFLQIIARYSAQALERLVLLEEERRSRAAAERGAACMTILYRLTRAVIDARSADEVYAAALDALEQALGARRASILLFDPDGVMRFKAHRGLSDEYRRAVEGHSPWSRDERDPQPIVVADVDRDAALAGYLPLFRSERIGALSFVPVLASGRLLGKFMVYYDEPRAPAADELDLAVAIANHVGAAVERFAAVAELEQAVHFNELFTGMLGHDLRNPLAAIMTAAQVMLRRPEADGFRRPLERVVGSGERMSRMIDQLLDFTRVRVGDGIPLRPADADLAPLVRQVVDELEETGAGCRFEVEAVGDTRGLWDGDRLAQVFSNLAGNALQHGDRGGTIRVRIDGSAPDQVCVEVDNPGAIPPGLLPHLFEPMKAGARTRERSGGLGLGLFISREIARSHGGDIRVRSSAADGTSFAVLLPRQATIR